MGEANQWVKRFAIWNQYSARIQTLELLVVTGTAMIVVVVENQWVLANLVYEETHLQYECYVYGSFVLEEEATGNEYKMLNTVVHDNRNHA